MHILAWSLTLTEAIRISILPDALSPELFQLLRAFLSQHRKPLADGAGRARDRRGGTPLEADDPIALRAQDVASHLVSPAYWSSVMQNGPIQWICYERRPPLSRWGPAYLTI